MKLRIAQLLVSRNLEANKRKIVEVISHSQAGEWVIFPEGMLSGYYPEDESFLSKLDRNQIEESIRGVQQAVSESAINCIFGTAFCENNNWYNAAIYVNKLDAREMYKKVNLATLDRKCFVAGDRLDVLDYDNVKFGIQLCRDNAFPEQWKVLKQKGAQVVFRVNNAIKETDVNRKHVLMARAFENQYFVVSVNNADKPQALPSLVVSPFGEIIFETRPQEESINVVEIDLSEVKQDYLKQARTDVVEVVYKK